MKAGMIAEKKGPKLDSEMLSIRHTTVKTINSNAIYVLNDSISLISVACAELGRVKSHLGQVWIRI